MTTSLVFPVVVFLSFAAAPCGPAKTKTKAKDIPGQDHAKFHKNQ